MQQLQFVHMQGCLGVLPDQEQHVLEELRIRAKGRAKFSLQALSQKALSASSNWT